MTVISSTVFERQISYQDVDVRMNTLRFFLWRNLALFPGGVNQFLIGTFTPVSSSRITLLLSADGQQIAQVTGMRGMCDTTIS